MRNVPSAMETMQDTMVAQNLRHAAVGTQTRISSAWTISVFPSQSRSAILWSDVFLMTQPFSVARFENFRLGQVRPLQISAHLKPVPLDGFARSSRFGEWQVFRQFLLAVQLKDVMNDRAIVRERFAFGGQFHGAIEGFFQAGQRVQDLFK